MGAQVIKVEAARRRRRRHRRPPRLRLPEHPPQQTQPDAEPQAPRRPGGAAADGRRTPTSSSKTSAPTSSAGWASTTTTLSQINPRLVYGSISGFGQTGPYSDRPGLDQIAQGLSGLMTVNGEPGPRTDARRPAGGRSDGRASCSPTASWPRCSSASAPGRGQWVHTSLLQANIRLMEFQAARYLLAGEVPGQAGNYHPISDPTGVYQASDGSLIIQAGGQTHVSTAVRRARRAGADRRSALRQRSRSAEASPRADGRARKAAGQPHGRRVGRRCSPRPACRLGRC